MHAHTHHLSFAHSHHSARPHPHPTCTSLFSREEVRTPEGKMTKGPIACLYSWSLEKSTTHASLSCHFVPSLYACKATSRTCYDGPFTGGATDDKSLHPPHMLPIDFSRQILQDQYAGATFGIHFHTLTCPRPQNSKAILIAMGRTVRFGEASNPGPSAQPQQKLISDFFNPSQNSSTHAFFESPGGQELWHPPRGEAGASSCQSAFEFWTQCTPRDGNGCHSTSSQG